MDSLFVFRCNNKEEKSGIVYERFDANFGIQTGEKVQTV